MEIAAWNRWWRLAGQQQLRDLLVHHWDPVHVREAPEAHDEYDSYLGPLGRRLYEGAGPREVATYLADVERDMMGFETTPQQLSAVGERVAAWYADSAAPR